MAEIDYLSARGLGDFMPMAGEDSGMTETIRSSLPTDYPARVRALELACNFYTAPIAEIMDSAARFHAFLMGTSNKENDDG